MKLLLLLTSAITLFACSAQARVLFKNVIPADRTLVEEKIPSLRSDSPSFADLDQAIRELMMLNTYQSVSVVKDNGAYVVEAVILKRIGDIKIGGNQAISDGDIRQAMRLKLGARFDITQLQDAAERVKELYGRRGYFNAIVGFDFQNISSSEVRLLVSVRERPPCIITNVRFLSINPALNAKLSKIIKHHENSPFSEDTVLAIEGDVNEYLKDHRYINAVLSQKDVTYNEAHTQAVLNYELSDPYRYQLFISSPQFARSDDQFFIHDAQKLTDRDVLRDLDLNNFTRGSRDPGLDIVNSIRGNFISKGYPNVQVALKEKVLKTEMIKRLLIDIDEGQRVQIRNIEIRGRISRPALYYSAFIRQHSSDTVRKKFYVKKDLENGYKNLITELNNQGYLRAKVQSSRAVYNEKKNAVTVIVSLDEGPLTELSKIDFEGVHDFTPAQLTGQLSIHPDAPLHLNHLEESIERLKSFYHDNGYLEMRLLNENENIVDYSPDGLSATVHFQIYEGPKIYVKAIEIEGNTFTKTYVIRRRMTIEPGDLLTPELLEENRRLIEETNLFSDVNIRMLEAGTNISQRTLIVAVTERNPGLFQIGAGMTNKNGLTARGRGGVSYNNIGGTGRAASIYSVVESNINNPNWLEYEIDLAYKEPFLFNSKWLGRVDVGHSEYFLDISNTQLLVTDSMSLSAERDLSSHTKFTWIGWGLSGESIYNVPSFGTRTLDNSVRIAYAGPILDMDYTDNRFLPTRGNLFRIDGLYADPGMGSSAKVNFYRSEMTFAHYIPLFGSSKWVWSNEVRGGYEKNINDIPGSGIPLSYAFFLGGYDTLEGYSGIGNDRDPNGVEFPVDPTKQVYIIPDSSDYFLVRSELRYPIHDAFGGVIFYDGGEVDVAGQTFHDPFRQSAGVGLRINTPVGPLSLDYGRKINQQPGEGPDAWQLYIGTF